MANSYSINRILGIYFAEYKKILQNTEKAGASYARKCYPWSPELGRLVAGDERFILRKFCLTCLCVTF